MDFTSIIILALLAKVFSLMSDDKDEASAYLDYLDDEVCKGKYEQASAVFNYYTNSIKKNKEEMDKQMKRFGLYGAKYKNIDWKSFNDRVLERQAKFYQIVPRPLDPKLFRASKQITDAMTGIFGNDYTICTYKNPKECGDKATKAAEDAYFNSRDRGELVYYWEQYNKDINKLMRPQFEKYVVTANAFSVDHGFSNTAQQWLDYYEDQNFEQVLLNLWNQVQPFYNQYFSYVRNRLRKHFGQKLITNDGPLEIQYFSFEYGQNLDSKLNSVVPYPEKKTTDVTEELVKQKYSVNKIVSLVSDYYTSLGLDPLPKSFWEKSMFQEPNDRPYACEESVYDFYNGQDYRIAVCGRVDSYTMYLLSNLFGVVYNAVGYRIQPCCFKQDENYGISEGIADAIPISFMSDKHLKKLGLCGKGCGTDPQVEINDFYNKANEDLVPLPMSLLTYLWQLDTFRNKIRTKEYNKAYWNLRQQYQGVKPPEVRGEEYLDAGLLHSVAEGIPGIDVFVSTLIKYQFYEAFCTAAGEYDPKNPTKNPLHKCDVYGSKAVGNILKNVYKYGASQPWTVPLQGGTGKSYIDAGPFLRYFEPFYNWLVQENKKSGEFIGWKK